MTDLLHEIMDDVRADRMGELWHKHGKWIIYTAVSIVIITAVLVYWGQHKRESAMARTAIYFEASELLAKGEAESALASLSKIAVPEKSAYYALVLLKQAQAQSMLGKADEAKKLFAMLAAREDMYGDIGKILVKDAATADIKKTSALQMSRMEWAAWELAGRGEHEKAARQFAALAKMENVPGSLRDRAQMMANYLKNKAESAAHE